MLFFLLIGLIGNLIFSVGLVNHLSAWKIDINKISLATVCVIFFLLTSFQTLILGAFGFLQMEVLLASSVLLAFPFFRQFTKACYQLKIEHLFPLFAIGFFCLNNPTQFSFDDKQYQALNPALWIQDGSIGLSTLVDYTGYYFFNSVLFNTYLMTFTKMNYDVFILQKSLALIILYFSFLNLFNSKNSKEFLNIFFVFLMVNPNISELLRFFNSPELFSTCLIIFIISIFRPTTGRALNIFISIIMGFICGMKVTFVLILSPFILFYIYAHIKEKQYLTLTFMIGIFSLCSSYWFFQNLIVTGNPLFPFEFFEMNSLITKGQSSGLSMVNVLKEIKIEKQIFMDILGRAPLRRIFTAISLVYFTGFIVYNLFKRNLNSITLACIGVLIFLICYPMLPNSGKGEDGNLAFVSFPRFFLIIQVLFPLMIVQSELIRKSKKYLPPILFALISIYLVGKSQYLFLAFTLIFLINQYLMNYPLSILLTFINGFFIIFFNQYQIQLPNLLDKIEPGKKITLINNYKSPALFFLGKNLRNKYIKLNANGESITPLHRYKNKVNILDLFPINLPKLGVTAKEYFTNLKNSDVDYVIFEKLPPQFSKEQTYPVQLQFFSMDYSTLIYDDGYYKIFKIIDR